MEYLIPFNKPYLSGNENTYLNEVLKTRSLSGNGVFTKQCQSFFEQRYGFKKCLLTTSCTDALEMASILCDIKPGDEVIVPSYTFVSTANPFILRGAKLVFVDSRLDHPGIDETKLESLINNCTKVIVVVHYAGVACDMNLILEMANKYKLLIVEDAAQAIDNTYEFPNGEKKYLGSLGHLATFSFHETKNVSCGEGGLLVVNDPSMVERAEIIWEKGTNRNAFFKGLVDKYNWVDVGSSFLPPELIAALLFAQLQKLDYIQNTRKKIWNSYKNRLEKWAVENNVTIPQIPSYSGQNAHMFYLVFNTTEERDSMISKLKSKAILAVFHYLSLHASPFFTPYHDGRVLPNADRYSQCLLRLPLYTDLNDQEFEAVIDCITS